MKNSNHFYLPFEKDGKFDYSPHAIAHLTEFEKYQLSFHPERPKYLDYLTLFNKVDECLSSKAFGSCLIQTHLAQFNEIPVMLIGQQSGPSSNYKQLRELMKDPDVVHKWNHGMPTAASYERAIEAIKLANKENRIIIIFVDTPGADPTEESEAGGIAWRIGGTIQALAESTTPTISIIINRGCSGGAIALTGTDVTLAMEYSTYLVITPEACSSILYHDRHHANEAAEASQITSKEGYALGIVDELIPESVGPAHRFKKESITSLGKVLNKSIEIYMGNPFNDLFQKRVDRWEKIGQWTEKPAAEFKNLKKKISRIPTTGKERFIKRHPGCYTETGMRLYDPVNLRNLAKENYVCSECGVRYIRPSAWDYIAMALDENSFVEHAETCCIVDKDILSFPGYAEKLKETREKTGLITAMITGNGTIEGRDVVFCATDFGFFGGSFCMSTGEKIWRAAKIAIEKRLPIILQAAGGGARMHEGCSSMVSIPKAHVALSKVEKEGLPVITIITDPTLGGVAIGYGSRGIQLFEHNAGNIGFSGKRVIEQYTGQKVSRDFQTTEWLVKLGHAVHVVTPENIRSEILACISE